MLRGGGEAVTEIEYDSKTDPERQNGIKWREAGCTRQAWVPNRGCWGVQMSRQVSCVCWPLPHGPSQLTECREERKSTFPVERGSWSEHRTCSAQGAVAQALLVLSLKARERDLLELCAKCVGKSLDWFLLSALVFRVADKNRIET